MNQPNAQGCPSCGQPSLSGYSSCLPSVSSFRGVLLLDERFCHLALWMIRLNDRFVWTTKPNNWVVGRSSCSVWPLTTGMGGAICTLFPMPIKRWSFLHLIVSAMGHLPAVSLLVIRPVFALRRRLIIIMGSWWPLPDCVP